MEIITVYSEDRMNPVNWHYVGKVQLLNVKAGGVYIYIYTYHSLLRG
jgi:hypothetical protein